VQHVQVPEGSITAELLGPEEKKPHGLLNPEGPDDGDLPNIYAAEDGTVNAELFSERVTLVEDEADERAFLLDEDGSALVIHEGPDDHMSQPIGGAGARVACAVIETVE
jgi:Cu-Zn family superoxide dismutase